MIHKQFHSTRSNTARRNHRPIASLLHSSSNTGGIFRQIRNDDGNQPTGIMQHCERYQIAPPRHFRPRFGVASLAWTPPRSTHIRRLTAHPGQHLSGRNAGRARVVPRNPAGQYIPGKTTNPHLRLIPARRRRWKGSTGRSICGKAATPPAGDRRVCRLASCAKRPDRKSPICRQRLFL